MKAKSSFKILFAHKIILMMLFSLPVLADIYKCTDKYGKVIYMDRPCAESSNKQEVYLKNSTKIKADKQTNVESELSKKASTIKPKNTIPEDQETEKVTQQEISQDVKRFFSFIWSGKIKEVKAFLDYDKSFVRVLDENSNLPLQVAAKTVNPDMVKLFVERGADVNEANIHGATPLFFVAMVGESSSAEQYEQGIIVAKYLIEKGADLTAKDNDGKSLLLKAGFYGNIFIARQVLEKGVTDKILSKTMYQAVWTGKTGIITLLLEYGADINAPNADGRTPIFGAAWTNRVEVAKLMVKKGAIIPKTGYTPLHLAAQYGKKEISQWLIQQGISVNASDQGRTPLHEAAWTGKMDYIIWLLEQGAIINPKNKDGDTPLHMAARWGETETVRLLLKRYANRYAENKQGNTPLDEAKLNNRADTVRAFGD